MALFPTSVRCTIRIRHHSSGAPPQSLNSLRVLRTLVFSLFCPFASLHSLLPLPQPPVPPTSSTPRHGVHTPRVLRVGQRVGGCRHAHTERGRARPARPPHRRTVPAAAVRGAGYTYRISTRSSTASLLALASGSAARSPAAGHCASCVVHQIALVRSHTASLVADLQEKAKLAREQLTGAANGAVNKL